MPDPVGRGSRVRREPIAEARCHGAPHREWKFSFCKMLLLLFRVGNVAVRERRGAFS